MRRVFTVEEANRMLPLVRRIAEDIRQQHARWREMVDACETAAARGDSASPEEASRLQRRAQALAIEIDGYIAELHDLGLRATGLEAGLVDFPGEIDGRPVYLCWQVGEPWVQFWHEENAGFAGRQPLLPDTFVAERRS
jgi:hypothetical protein